MKNYKPLQKKNFYLIVLKAAKKNFKINLQLNMKKLQKKVTYHFIYFKVN